MTRHARTTSQRTRPTPRIVLLVLLSLVIYGAGANIGAGTVLMLAAGMLVGTAWSVTGFLRRVGDLRVLLEPGLVAIEGRTAVPLTVSVPRGVIGVIRLVPCLPPDVAARLVRATAPGNPAPDEQWSTLPRSGTSARLQVTAVLARGDSQQLDVELELTDLFGLVRRRVTMTGPVADVTPAPGAAAAFAADTVEGADDEWIAHALAGNGTPGTELRPWRPGEAVRAVHWPASERAGELLVRPRGPETSQHRTLTVEDRDWTRAALDERCRDIAATAERLAQAGVEVEVAAGGQVVPWGVDAARLLASLRPNASSVAPTADAAAPASSPAAGSG